MTDVVNGLKNLLMNEYKYMFTSFRTKCDVNINMKYLKTS